jgi:hypothetical protein
MALGQVDTLLAAHEELERRLLQFLRQAGTGVSHAHDGEAVINFRLHRDTAARRSIARGIVEQFDQRLLQQRGIALEDRLVLRQRALELNVVINVATDRPHSIGYYRVEFDVLAAHVHVSSYKTEALQTAD